MSDEALLAPTDAVVPAPRALKSWEPAVLRPVHKKIIALSAAGMRNNEIAEMLDLSEAWVSVIINHPEAQDIRSAMVTDFVQGLHGGVREMIMSHSAEAVLKVVHLMRTGKENIALAASKDILDRAGFKPKEETINTNINLGAQDALEIRRALEEMRTELPPLSETELTSAAFRPREGGA